MSSNWRKKTIVQTAHIIHQTNIKHIKQRSHYFQDRAHSGRHACVLALRAGSGMQRRRRGSVRPEQPERTVTMSFSIGPTESQRQNRAPNSRHTNTDPDRHQLRPPAAGCPGEREGLWHRRTLFWRTLSGVQVVSLRVGGRLVFFWGGGLVSPGCLDPDSTGIQSNKGGLVEDEPTLTHFISAFICSDGAEPLH